MLCEQCQTMQATVHFAVVSWRSDELTKHLCETCYREVDEERIKTYNTRPSAPLPVGIENISALEYLEASDRAHANSADAPAFRHISKELRGLPSTRERLAFELLEMAWKDLERGKDSFGLIGLGGCFGSSVSASKRPEYVQLLEKIIRLSIDKMAESANPASPHPFGLGLTQAGIALRRGDPQRFTDVLGILKAHCDGEGKESRRKVIDYLESTLAEADLFAEKALRPIKRTISNMTR